MNLEALIQSMSGAEDGKEPVGSKTASWKAFRTAEQIDDLSLIPELKVYLEEHSEAATRTYAYDILKYIGKNTGDARPINILMDRIPVEENQTQPEGIFHDLLYAIYSSEIPLQARLEEMLIFAFDERELIRTTAIQLLSRYTIGHEKIKDALLEVVEYHYDEYDLRYAVESLQILFPGEYKQWVVKLMEELIQKEGDDEIVHRIKNSIEEA